MIMFLGQCLEEASHTQVGLIVLTRQVSRGLEKVEIRQLLLVAGRTASESSQVFGYPRLHYLPLHAIHHLCHGGHQKAKLIGCFVNSRPANVTLSSGRMGVGLGLGWADKGGGGDGGGCRHGNSI